jgi:beta-lactamase class A
VLLSVAVFLGVGPRELREFASGLVFQRPPAAAIAPATRHEDLSLDQRLLSISTEPPYGRVSIEAIDLQTGATASIDATRSYPAASLFKLPILITVLGEEDAGELDPSRQVEIRPEDWTDGSGVLQARVGDHLSVAELSRLMIQQSDNIAALALLDVVGVPSVNAIAERLGLTATRIVDRRAGEPGDHTTSAADMAHLFSELATGAAINQRVSEEALSLLELKQSVTWLGDDLPFWVKVAHKWGDLPDERHDAGIVFTPRGSFVLAVLTENVSPGDAAATIARSARITYDYVGGR